MKLQLKVDVSATGRHTLKKRAEGETTYQDYHPGPDSRLFGNEDQATFYRAVAQELADLVSQGFSIHYMDKRA